MTAGKKPFDDPKSTSEKAKWCVVHIEASFPRVPLDLPRLVADDILAREILRIVLGKTCLSGLPFLCQLQIRLHLLPVKVFMNISPLDSFKMGSLRPYKAISVLTPQGEHQPWPNTLGKT